MPNTLFGRLLVASLILLGLYFSFIGVVIDRLFQENIVTSKHQQLRLQNSVLLSAAQFTDDDSIALPEDLRESRFDDFESGLYGFITNPQGNILWSSYSAHNLPVDPIIFTTTKEQPGTRIFSQTPEYFVYQHFVLWEFIEDQPQLLNFSVLEDKRPTLEKFALFEQRLSIWLTGVGITLIALLLLILRWGTAPLRQLEKSLKQVEAGESNLLEGRFPVELRGITNNLNELLLTEKRQRERYQSTLSDLAHSLKTPLAVIQAELESKTSELALITEQCQRMDDIITHQLQRAVVATPHKLGETVSIKDSVERITKALNKVYASKGLQCDNLIDDRAFFKGDQRDLMEVLGNILDNAYKACTQQVQVQANVVDNKLIIVIHDDGPGIPADQRQHLIKRGLRADTRYSGQGIGLDVARDIIESYQGILKIDESPLGGAFFEIHFPV